MINTLYFTEIWPHRSRVYFQIELGSRRSTTKPPRLDSKMSNSLFFGKLIVSPLVCPSSICSLSSSSCPIWESIIAVKSRLRHSRLVNPGYDVLIQKTKLFPMRNEKKLFSMRNEDDRDLKNIKNIFRSRSYIAAK